MPEKSTFEKILDDEEVTEAEVKQMWAEAPVMTVSQQSYDEMMAAVEDDPKELNRLAGLFREQQPW